MTRQTAPRTSRTARFAAALLLAGGAMVAAPVTVAFAQTADESPALGVFNVTADATGIGVSFGDPNASPYPVASGWAPHASAFLGSGPSGRALSSVMWPGPLLANAGSLANVIGTPLPPEVVANANYPVKAEASAGAGGRDEQTVGPMRAIVDGAESTAVTALTDFSATGLVSAARVTTTSRSFLEGDSAVSVAESVLQGVEIGGVLRIETVRTIARGTTDGKESTTSQEVTVAGVTVNGQPATIDEEGLHLGGQTNENPLVPVADGANEGLSQMGLQAFVTRPYQHEGSGAAAVLHTGAVVVDWDFFGSGQHVTVVLGGSGVALSATPGVGFGGFDTDFGDFGGDAGGPTGDFGSGSFTPGSGFDAGISPLPMDDAPSVTPSGGGGSGGAAQVPGVASFDLASSVSDRVPMGWMIIGMAGMVLLGMGLHGMRERALAAAVAGTTCPLERST